MKILLISPLEFAVGWKEQGYAGIEELVWQFANELAKEHSVTVIGNAHSIFPKGVQLLPHIIDSRFRDELKTYQAYRYRFGEFDVIHDFSHLHLTARFNPLPCLSIFWHAPALAKYPKAPYNIIALSNWAVREFHRIYGQKARYQQSIALNPDIYQLGDKERTDRFLTLGKMSPEKGNHNAIMLCKKLGLKLDVVGGRGSEAKDSKLSEYELSIRDLCDGEQIRFLGEISQEQKLELFQTARALLYITDHPEVTSHKSMEAIACGLPVIASNIGAMPEIIQHGINGFLCSTEFEFVKAIKDVDKIDSKVCADTSKEWQSPKVVKDYVKLYEEVAEGLRW